MSRLLYAWFESFPLVYGQGYGFNPGESGVAFLGIFVGAWYVDPFTHTYTSG